MSRDGMTPGDRARKQARLREMRDTLAAKENVTPRTAARRVRPETRESRGGVADDLHVAAGGHGRKARRRREPE